MFGNTQRDLYARIPGANGMKDFGATTQYELGVSQAGMRQPQNLDVGPRSVTNIYNIQPIQLVSQMPQPNTNGRPLSRLRSNYAFLPIGKVNLASTHQ